jgi:ATP-dependent helicase HrpA
MVEEFKVSIFAQELGTAFPISPKKLDEALAEIRAGLGGEPPAASR